MGNLATALRENTVSILVAYTKRRSIAVSLTFFLLAVLSPLSKLSTNPFCQLFPVLVSHFSFTFFIFHMLVVLQIASFLVHNVLCILLCKYSVVTLSSTSLFSFGYTLKTDPCNQLCFFSLPQKLNYRYSCTISSRPTLHVA